MIYLKEQIPYKLPGETSFSVLFNYDQRIVDTIKQVPNAIYHNKLKSWEIPATSLSRAITLLSNLDSIDITLLEEEIKEPIEVKLNEESYLTKPFPYQLEGIKFGLTNSN